MIDLPHEHQIKCVTNFEELVSMPFDGGVNAICWTRELVCDFGEIVDKVKLKGTIAVLEPEELLALELSEQGQLARQILLNDLKLLTAHGSSPTLNLIRCYDRDDA